MDTIANVNNLNTLCTFIGKMSIGNIDPSQYNIGDIFVDSETNILYVNIGDRWDKIGEPDLNGNTTTDNEFELKQIICSSCGAPIKIKSRYDTNVKCEYCGSTYLLGGK